MEFLYSDINGKYKITGFNGECDIIEIPDSINGVKVTEIGDEAFNKFTRMKDDRK